MQRASRPEATAVRNKAEAARAAALALQGSADAVRADALRRMATRLRAAATGIEGANAQDVADARRQSLPAPLIDRLGLDAGKRERLLDGVQQIAAMPDPLGRTLRATRLDTGLDVYQITVPIGVVGVVFESRPDALVQISALAVRSGNAVLLKGGKEAERTNMVLAEEIRAALADTGLPRDAVQLLAGRAEVDEMLGLEGLVDLIIPRGSSAFVRHIIDHSRIPVLGHAEGVCHVYVDKAADLDRAVSIVVDAKADYPAACNAVETVLVHRDIAESFLLRLQAAAEAAGITLRDDPAAFGKEFGDLTAAVGIVDDVGAAIAHVNRYGTRHTDAIVTEDRDAARRFVTEVDASSVLVNASTRFADGYRYGLGAEVGIATGKLHARGPMGVEGLTTTKWVVLGTGQVAGDYQGPGAKQFLHEPLGRSFTDAWPAQAGEGEGAKRRATQRGGRKAA